MSKIEKNIDFYNFIKYGSLSDEPMQQNKELKVADLMSPNPYCLKEEEEISPLEEVMQLEKIHHLPVVNHAHEVVGILTHRDFLALIISQKKENLKKKIAVGQVMKRQIETISQSESLITAAERFYRSKIGSLLVVEGKKLVGIITPFDLLKLLDKKSLS